MSPYCTATAINNFSLRVASSCPPLDKLGIVAVWNKADILAVSLLCSDKPAFFCQAPRVRFLQFTQREAKMRQLLLCQHIQNIALIFLLICSLKKLPAFQFFTVAYAGIVACNQNIETFCFRLLHQRFKFQKLIAVDTGVWCPAVFIFPDKLSDYLFFKESGKACRFMWDSQLVAYENRILLVGIGTAASPATARISSFPEQPHGNTGTLVSGFFHQQCRDRAVHTAAHGNHGSFHSVFASRKGMHILLYMCIISVFQLSNYAFSIYLSFLLT